MNSIVNKLALKKLTNIYMYLLCCQGKQYHLLNVLCTCVIHVQTRLCNEHCTLNNLMEPNRSKKQQKLMLLYLAVKIGRLLAKNREKKPLQLIEITSHSQWMEIAEIYRFSSILLAMPQHNWPDFFASAQSSYMQFIIFFTSSDVSVPIHHLFLCSTVRCFFCVSFVLWSWSWFHNCTVIHLFIMLAAHDSGHNLAEDQDAARIFDLWPQWMCSCHPLWTFNEYTQFINCTHIKNEDIQKNDGCIARSLTFLVT